jgi:YgiT-type zinc finger domain-containing protein
MECLHCKARMRCGTAPFTIDQNGYHVSWDNIPAWVCDQCGEVLFEAREVDLIQEALASLDRETAALVGQSAR